eukprot:1177773-Prorocentrum_minimum.AAC.1
MPAGAGGAGDAGGGGVPPPPAADSSYCYRTVRLTDRTVRSAAMPAGAGGAGDAGGGGGPFPPAARGGNARERLPIGRGARPGVGAAVAHRRSVAHLQRV